MIYSNQEFLIFLTGVLLVYFAVGARQEHKFWVLTAASLAFYAWAGLFDSLIFVFVVLVSWGALWLAHHARERESRRAFVTGGIVIMALHLLFWKYAPWLCGLVQQVYPEFLNGRVVHLPLPVGISFFTLQGIAYLVDYERGDARYIGLKQFLLFKSFFPQLVAGPIVRAHQLAPQLMNLPKPSLNELREGMTLFAVGFFKKVAVADRMAVLVDPVFANPSNYSASSIVLAVLAYTVQIWGDFSGYTDMGRGTAKMFGIHLPENFLSPYLSRSPSEFWRRWHVTLSQWIRDYIYIPLGGARGGVVRISAVVVLTMGVSGLWHGAAVSFMVWGLYHGALLVLERLATRCSIPLFIGRGAIIYMFALTALGWLIFRATSLEQALGMLKLMFGIAPAGPTQIGVSQVMWGVLCCLAFHVMAYKPLDGAADSLWQRLSSNLEARFAGAAGNVIAVMSGAGIAILMIFALILRVDERSAKFIYFQF